MNHEYRDEIGQKSLLCRSDDSTMMTFMLIVFFFLIPFILEDVTFICQASYISVVIPKSLFPDPPPTATDLALNDRNCKAIGFSNTFYFDITHGTCGTALIISKDGKIFYHNVVFDTRADPDDPKFDIICLYLSKYAIIKR